MPARNVILRLMLWSLGLAAVTGVLAVFVRRGDFMWRVVGTEIGAAVACAIILPCIRLIDRERTRASGLVGMVTVVLVFILALFIIWDLPRVLTGTRWEEELFFTIFLFVPAALVAMPLLRLKHHTEHNVTARFSLWMVALSTCAFLVAIWRQPSYEAFNDNCALSGLAVIAMGTIVSVSLLGLGAPGRWWRWIGVGFASAAFVLWLGDIWIGSGSDIGMVTFTTFLCASATVAYAIGCQLVPLKPEQLWYRGAMIVTVAVTGLLVVFLVIVDRGLMATIDAYWIERFTAAAGIVTGCGTLALAVLARLNRRVDFVSDDEALTEIVVFCPRCRKKQSLPIGDARCGGCQLRISTRVEEPRCPACEYLVVGLTSDRCPECGAAIAGVGEVVTA